MPSRYGVAFRDQAALARVLGHARGLKLPPKQLSMPGMTRRPRWCVGCGRARHANAPCPDCGAFTCQTCDQTTSANGGVEGTCLECLLVGRDMPLAAE